MNEPTGGGRDVIRCAEYESRRAGEREGFADARYLWRDQGKDSCPTQDWAERQLDKASELTRQGRQSYSTLTKYDDATTVYTTYRVDLFAPREWAPTKYPNIYRNPW